MERAKMNLKDSRSVSALASDFRTRTLLFGCFGVLSLFLYSPPLEARFLRSAGLYYTPQEQIEANTTFQMFSQESLRLPSQTRSTIGILGARFEQGLNPNVSWGSQFSFGKGTHEVTTRGGSGESQGSIEYEGLLDPEVFIKSHFDRGGFRLHANSVFRFKGDALIQTSDQIPLNFSSGGSSLALQLGVERPVGPTIIGLDLQGDLWRDVQEVVEINATGLDTLYFREGSRWSSVSLFAEFSQFRFIKPGLRIRETQISASKTEIQPNQRRSPETSLFYGIAPEEQTSASFYGRVRLPGHFVLNFEVFGLRAKRASDGDPFEGTSYGLTSNIGLKF